MGLIKLVANTDQLAGPSIPVNPSLNRSLDFADSAAEILADSALNSFICNHMRNKFSIGVWFKRGTSATTKTIYNFAFTTGENGRVRLQTTSTQLNIFIAAPTSTVTQKQYRLTATDANWQHIVIVVDRGASEELIVYKNGAAAVVTKVTDTALSDRSGFNVTFINDVGQSLTGPMYSLAVWDTALAANEIPVIYNGGNAPPINLLVNKGKYRSGKKCKHWFVYEANSADIGKDYGRASSEDIDLMNNAVNINSSDLIFDAPIG